MQVGADSAFEHTQEAKVKWSVFKLGERYEEQTVSVDSCHGVKEERKVKNKINDGHVQGLYVGSTSSSKNFRCLYHNDDGL
jgi:hypothetical protein